MEGKQDFFPEGEKRKRLLISNEGVRNNFAADGSSSAEVYDRYTWLDSGLEGLSNKFNNPFDDTFHGLYPEEEGLKKYIESELEGRRGKAVGVEFGGVGVRPFSDFSKGFFAQSAGVTLVDHRRHDQIMKDEKQCKAISHTVMQGDIFSQETYDKLEHWLNGKKIDLIMERMGKGVEFVPEDIYTAGSIINRWYKLLNEGGLMFVQTPVVYNNQISTLSDRLLKYRGSIEFVPKLGDTDHRDCSSFKLRKLPGAPENLPLLDREEARRIPKWKNGDYLKE